MLTDSHCHLDDKRFADDLDAVLDRAAAAGITRILTITIHTREAWDDTIATLRQHWSGPGIMHCFTGDPAQAQEALGLGFHLSYGGVLTFKTAENVRESARITPDDRLLLETDAPYL